MESPRESKRRKLDTPSKQSPATTTTARKRATPKTKLSGTPASRARQAKQAQSGNSPLPQSKDNAHDQAEPVAAPSQSALEKLKAKHQTQGGGRNTVAAPSPAKVPLTPSKAGMAGFFKKFADPRLVSMREEEAGGGSSEDALDEDSDGSPSSTIRVSGRKKSLTTKLREQADERHSKSQSASAVKKKTFEDEIHELEEAARKEAGADNATPRTGTRQTGSRTNTPKQTMSGSINGRATREEHLLAEKPTPVGRKSPLERKTPAERATPAGKGTPAEKKPRGRPRKSVEPQAVAIPEQAVPEILIDGDAMELDDSEEGRLAATRGPTSPTLNRPQTKGTPQRGSAKMTREKSSAAVAELPSLTQAQTELLQYMTLEKMHGKRPIPLTNLSDEYTKVNTVISQTITAGESNSMLLIGARGSGKTALVNHVLREQAKEHPDDFHAVRLNGFIHTDDKIALREIWRQLGREMDLDEEENTTRNYADTLASLLALLSHPLELGQEQAPGQTNKSVIFILDEFELFASHPRQTLLYNLFDIAQSRKAPIAVLGLTTRNDVAESLEKRVKSRFSHRYVHLSSPKSFSAFVDVCKAALCLEEDSVHEHERDTFDLDVNDSAGGSALDTWNSAIEDVFASETFVAMLRRIYYTTKSVNDLLAALLMPLSTLPESAATAIDIQEHITTALGPKLMSPDSKLILLSTVSTLQLALLICAARQTAIHSTETVSFNLAYEEYKLLASKAKIQAAASGAMGAGGRLWTKDIAKDAWMDLIDVGLMMEDGYSGRTGGGAAGRADVSLEEIARSGVDLGSWGRWCKEI
jgi:origin recognition complex subunit 4